MKRQLGLIALVAVMFAAFDIAVYNIFTKRYINNTNPEMQAKSIELSKYLPFDENSGIVKIDSAAKLGGKLPVIDGAAALYPVFSGFVNAVYPSDSVFFDGENFTDESALHYTNTRGAYSAIVDGTADVIFCAAPSREQLEYAEQNSVELELVPIGREAFVFIVNKNNPVDDLAVEQVKGIYSGEIKKWSEVGGENRYIDALQRNAGSGSQSQMLAFMDAPMKRSLTGIFGSAIGFSFRYYVEGIVENSDVKMLSLNGVYPSPENIADESYPLVSSFYAVYRKDDDNPNIPVLIDWILSDEGQRIVEESGYAALK
ncbi:MAG: phosphate ABC transporter substrate-binding protein, PhoT family [Ruminococcaceae bacterium]|nr:phosphate ABC transporter substrate-binding protein, PhoT family [Oscillospiraceae bacterium]